MYFIFYQANKPWCAFSHASCFFNRERCSLASCVLLCHDMPAISLQSFWHLNPGSCYSYFFELAPTGWLNNETCAIIRPWTLNPFLLPHGTHHMEPLAVEKNHSIALSNHLIQIVVCSQSCPIDDSRYLDQVILAMIAIKANFANTICTINQRNIFEVYVNHMKPEFFIFFVKSHDISKNVSLLIVCTMNFSQIVASSQHMLACLTHIALQRMMDSWSGPVTLLSPHSTVRKLCLQLRPWN